MCELKERKEETSIGMNVQWRIAVIFKLTVSGSGIIKKAEMGDFLVEKDSKTDSLIFTTTVKNTGNIHFIANGLLVVRDKDNRRVGQAKLVSGKGTVLPESMRDFKAEYKRPLRVGEYTAEAIIRYKGRRSIFKKIPFTVGLTKDIDSTDEIKEDYRIEVASFRLNPKSLDLKIPGGGFRRAAINIANQTELPVKLRIYMSDIKVNSKDSKDSSKYIGQLKNCVVFSPVNLLLMPNKAKKVILNIKIPKNIKGKFNTKLIFEPIDDGKKQGLDSATAELKLNLV